MSEQGLSYEEACREIGRHGARRRAALRQKATAAWSPAPRQVATVTASRHPHPQPSPATEHHWEQTKLSFL